MDQIPNDVIERVRDVLATCNAASTETLSMNPNTQEEWLDHTWISEIARHASPRVLPSGWLIKIEAHFLGGMRHFDRWEIADIGVLVQLRTGSTRTRKVVLLQSKRLYPLGVPVRDDTRSDFEIGFARLADPEDDALSLSFATDYRFTPESQYGALRRNDPQVTRIAEYERQPGFSVYYQLYNPWTIPIEQRVPVVGHERPSGCPPAGVRVVPAATVRERLLASSSSALRARDLDRLSPLPPLGWRLEDFIADEVLSCREGTVYDSVNDTRMRALFNRRTGAIAAAIAITVESPDAATVAR